MGGELRCGPALATRVIFDRNIICWRQENNPDRDALPWLGAGDGIPHHSLDGAGRSHAARRQDLLLHPDDGMIGTADNAMEAWPSGDAAQARRLFPPAAGPAYTFAPDGAWAAGVSDGGSEIVIHDATGHPRATLPGLWPDLDSSPDGRWLLAAGHTGYCLWDAASWRPVFDAAQQTADRFFGKSTTIPLRADGAQLHHASAAGGRRLSLAQR